MKGFLRTFIVGLAALFLIFAGAVVTVGLAAGSDVKRVMREYVLSDEEKETLRQARNKVAEPALIPREQPRNTDEILEALAERVGSNKINELAEEFKAKLNGLTERTAYLDQRYTELRIAEGDLDRKARQIKRERLDLLNEQEIYEKESADFARKQLEIVKQVQLISDIEQKRMLDQVKMLEQMKDAAWKSIRRNDPLLIARYLSLMDAKKAARLLTLANEDEEYLGLGHDIIKAWRTIDLEGISGDQINRLADLYVYLKPDEVADILIAEKDVEQAAMILLAIQERGGAKKSAAVNVLLNEKDELFAADIDKFMLKYKPEEAAQ